MALNLEGLSLFDHEEEGLVFHKEGRPMEERPVEGPNFELCLIGRFLTDRSIRVNAMMEMMSNVWRQGRE